jgi:6-phosphogluconate dehydrogenase (decarboxylating)
MTTSNPMQLGMVGLGRMGAKLVRRLMHDGHHCVVFDVNREAVEALEKEGATGATSVGHRVRHDRLARRRAPTFCTTPMPHRQHGGRRRDGTMESPEFYRFDIDTTAGTELWRRGSIVESFLLDLTAEALLDSPELKEFAGRVSDSGEGRWTSIAAIDEGIPAPVLTTALYSRFFSRGLDDFADKSLSARRKGFGAPDEKKA